jgi:hypothetical protein
MDEKTHHFQRVFEERMKGLEPSTVCTASPSGTYLGAAPFRLNA